MHVYIASSWKNQHAVEMLTALLRDRGITVISFVEAAVEAEGRDGLKWDFEEWIWSEDGRRKFEYDTNAATLSDLVIYIGPSGIDAWGEIGAAWYSGTPIFGLWAKGENAGLMRRMMSHWFNNFRDLLISTMALKTQLEESADVGG